MTPLLVPHASAQIVGGPLIDACVYGSRELYPGQIVTLQLLVQNSGYVESLYGYRTSDSLLHAGNAYVTAAGNSLSQKTILDSSSYRFTASGAKAGVAGAQAGSLGGSASASQSSISRSLSSSSYSYYQSGAFADLEINSDPCVPAAVTTALGITCVLGTGDAPIEIVSDSRMLLGALPSGSTSAPVPYLVRVSRDARPGHYRLPLLITYKRLAEDFDYASIFGPLYAYNNYVEESCIVYLDIVIMDIFDLIISDVSVTDMVPGSNGIVTVRVNNLGDIGVDNAIVYLMSSTVGPAQDSFYYPLNYQLMNYQTTAAQTSKTLAQNMLVPIQNSQYVGHIEPGGEALVKFKMSVSDDAEEGDFPVSAVVSYDDPWGIQKSSNVATFGAHVEPEMRFGVDPAPIEIRCGRSATPNLTLTNEGTLTARDAIVRMNALDPFTVSYDTMYLGDVNPGANASTKYGIKVKSDAVPGTYFVTLEVKYYDRQDDPHVTKIIRKPITVLPPPGLWDLLLENLPLVFGLFCLLLAGLAYLAHKRLKGRKKPGAAPGTSP